MKRTFSNTHLALTVLCAAVLTACGGNGDSNFLGEKSQHNNFGGGSGGKPLDPTNKSRSAVDIFLVTMANEGKQTKNIVASVDDDGNGNISYGDAVRFNQPGVISCITGGSGGGPGSGASGSGEACGSLAIQELLQFYENAVKSAEQEKSSADQVLGRAQDALNDEKKKQQPNSDRIVALEKEVNQAQQVVDRAAKTLMDAQNRLEKEKKNSTAVAMLDVNQNLHSINVVNTIDERKSNYSEFLSHDVGARKIDAERKVESGKAKLYNYGGSIGRAYNGIILFAAIENATQKNGYVDIYLRDPAAAGWSYNTFGAFSSGFLRNARDVNIGYQSIGKEVEDLPTSGTAKYLGIAHAYINDIEASRYSQKANSQVTMDVEINADFGKRSLGFDTRNTYIHTYEGPNDQHIIQARPDLNLHGSAGWNQGVGDFKGQLRNEGGNLTGSIEGSFYGPKAAEVGGVFGLSGDDKEALGSRTYRTHYVGGFGAKRD